MSRVAIPLAQSGAQDGRTELWKRLRSPVYHVPLETNRGIFQATLLNEFRGNPARPLRTYHLAEVQYSDGDPNDV